MNDDDRRRLLENALPPGTREWLRRQVSVPSWDLSYSPYRWSLQLNSRGEVVASLTYDAWLGVWIEWPGVDMHAWTQPLNEKTSG